MNLLAAGSVFCSKVNRSFPAAKVDDEKEIMVPKIVDTKTLGFIVIPPLKITTINYSCRYHRSSSLEEYEKSICVFELYGVMRHGRKIEDTDNRIPRFARVNPTLKARLMGALNMGYGISGYIAGLVTVVLFIAVVLMAISLSLGVMASINKRLPKNPGTTDWLMAGILTLVLVLVLLWVISGRYFFLLIQGG